MSGRVVVLGASTTDMNIRLPELPRVGQTILGGDFFTGPGGKGANQAVAAVRAGAKVTFLTAFGDDHLSEAIRRHDIEEGIDVAHAKLVPGSTCGVALIFIAENGDNLIGVAMGANSRLTPTDIDALPSEVFDPSGVLLVSLEVPIETAVRAIDRAWDAGMRVVLNPAPADRRIVEGELPRKLHLLTPNQSELEVLTGIRVESPSDLERACADLLARGVPNLIVTLGGAGCLALSAGSSPREIPAFAVEATDTVGAGDAFNGALATAIAEGRPLYEAAEWASAAAAIAVTKPGAQGALPKRIEIDRMRREGKRARAC